MKQGRNRKRVWENIIKELKFDHIETKKFRIKSENFKSLKGLKIAWPEI